ncbi:putative E3 ubiquitin-protein ligase UBR7 [Neolamprologus brichardi]|uniref:putative E3 ubiquitin-protein ligase UBR7 n=1 Tax=Neolamprologus brichardi TaxID=32507 RepID=UPI001643A06D|nr:putative E3 ubiquitin-protein ligase UBR7 [Neolamprologus brichardi]
MCEEQTVSLVDVLEEDEELEEEASAVLAGSDSDHCSYPQGYVKRQALYACNTCTPKGSEAAGICLACSYKCHEGHDLFELYTKRNFRCDCGNGKFSELQCKLHPDKDEVNSLNKYSQNFFGVYCTCGRPYPDPEDQHFLCVYVCVCDALPVLVPGGAAEVKEETAKEPTIPIKEEEVDDAIEPSCKRSREEVEPRCRLKELQVIGQKRVQSGAVFWPSPWRSKLCSCRMCQLRLLEAGLSFLLDESDTVLAYENKGKNSEQRRQEDDPLMSALDNLNHVQQLEIIHGTDTSTTNTTHAKL